MTIKWTNLILLVVISGVVSATPFSSPSDYVQVYEGNGHYIQYRGQPLIPIGANPGWVATLQKLDYDYRAEFEALHESGGNLLRLSPFITPGMEDETRFDERVNCLPWAKVDTYVYDLDLEWSGGNPAFWERLRQVLDLAYELDHIVALELWDLYGPARGPKFTPNRWAAHPFYPGNNKNLTGEQELDRETDMLDIALCRPVTRGPDSNPEALRLLEMYIRSLLDVLSQYPNIIYIITNETSAAKSWSDYWVDFVHAYFRKNLPDYPYLVGVMPREFQHSKNFTIQDLILDPRMDFADASQYLSWMDQCDIHMKNYLDLMAQYPSCVKPILNVKNYMRTDVSALWSAVLVGAATTRFHRPAAATPEADWQIQLRGVKFLREFLNRYEIHPWNMHPEPWRFPRGRYTEKQTFCLVNEKKMVVYFHNALDEVHVPWPGGGYREKVPSESIIGIIDPGNYRGLWYDPEDGTAMDIGRFHQHRTGVRV
ncbi:hypothetical protein ACFLT7_08720, partial [candidate division KSB1 bacterium]